MVPVSTRRNRNPRGLPCSQPQSGDPGCCPTRTRRNGGWRTASDVPLELSTGESAGDFWSRSTGHTNPAPEVAKNSSDTGSCLQQSGYHRKIRCRLRRAVFTSTAGLLSDAVMAVFLFTLNLFSPCSPDASVATARGICK